MDPKLLQVFCPMGCDLQFNYEDYERGVQSHMCCEHCSYYANLHLKELLAGIKDALHLDE